jgi:enoyl-CoA hydratase
MSVLLVENRDGALWVTFNRPEAFNSFCPEMMCAIMDMWEMAERDDSVKLVVLTGAGDKAFSSGGDLKLTIPLLTGARQPENEFDHRYMDTPDWPYHVFQRNRTFSKPVIAAVNGAAMAGGIEMMLATDIRIAASNATFALSEVKVGVIAAGGSTSRLPRQLPWCHAMKFLLTGETINAERALEMGLINTVVEPQDLYDEVERLVDQLKRNAPLSMQAIKRTALATSGMTLEEAFALEDEEGAAVFRTQDALEGPKAFAEKRQPKYVGR